MKRLDQVGIAFAIFSVFFCVLGLRQLRSNTEDVLQWLPDHSQARQQYNFFEQHFGSDDFLILTWDGCTIEDPRLDALTGFIRGHDSTGLIQSVTHGGEVAQRMSAELNFTQAEIAQRLRGTLFGINDPSLTCVIIDLSQRGTANRRDVMQLVWSAIEAVPHLNRDEVVLGGYPYIATFIDQQLGGSFRHFLVPSVVLATLVALCCLRNLVLALIVFVAAVGASASSIALVPICGFKYGGLMSIIPALVFVLATSGSIHLVRYGLDAIGDVRRLLRIGWKPCTISAVTTAVGMLSLTRSSFPAIRNFGLFCATGVGFALAYQLIIVPWLLHRFGQRGLSQLASQSEDSSFWSNWSRRVREHRIAISVVSLLFMVLGGYGLSKLEAEVEVEKLFRPNSEILISIAEMEYQLGPLDQTELLLVFDAVDPEQFPDRANLIRQIQASLKRLPEVEVAHSLANFLPAEPRKTNLRSFAPWSTYRNRLRAQRAVLAEGNLLQIDGSKEIWRISLRFPFTQKHDFDKIAGEVTEGTESVIDTAGTDLETRPRVIYTGKTQLFNHAQKTLLTDLFRNFLLAFVIITPVLIVVLRSWQLGLIAMLPNLFPALVVFGGLGWGGHPVDLAIAMTASVALGIAVDDTTHFLIRFRDYGGRLDRIRPPIEQAIRQCGPAMFHTTMIGGAGLIVYSFSDMLVVSRFSWAITVLLIIALLADVIMLPAILFLVGGSDQTGDG